MSRVTFWAVLLVAALVITARGAEPDGKAAKRAARIAALLKTKAPEPAKPASAKPDAAKPEQPVVAKLDTASIEFFEKKVRPILVASCYECHASTSQKVKGGLLLDSAKGVAAGGDSGEAVVPGDPEASLLILAVRWADKDTQMPPKQKLPDEQIRVLEQWVKMGAPDPRTQDAAGGTGSASVRTGAINIDEGRKFWAFQPVKKPWLPAVRTTSWPRGDIDRFVLEALEAKNLKPVRDADKLTLLRRVTFDLTGLPPTEKEIDAYLADATPGAFEKVVDRLLASPQFGERWGRHWLDVARYAESTGMSRNYPYQYAWRYRDYVIDSFNKDKPYDQFVMEQIAGDLMEAGAQASVRDERKIATGFLALGSKDLNERNQLQFLMDNVDEQIDVMSRSMLAMSISCARCHDHKFDPIPQTDYYGIAGIFRSSEMLSGYGAKQGGGNKLNEGTLHKLSGVTGDLTPAQQDAAKKLAALTEELEQARQKLARLQKAKGNNKADKPGKSDRAEAREEKIAEELRDARQDVAKLESRVNELEKIAPASSSGAFAMGVREGKVGDTPLYIKGEVEKPGKVVPRGLLQVATPISVSTAPAMPANASGRLQLAQWIASPDNPLTARVMANRIWHHLFGDGIVRTVDNFGIMGEKPANPALLDHLATRLVANGWSVKKTIREVVLSRTYQLSSDFNRDNFNIDADNRLCWRQSQRRLEVEALRDAILSASGSLDLKPAEASPIAKLPAGEIGNQKKGGGVFDADSALSSKRSVYIPIVRSGLPNMYELFDFAEPSMVNGDREVTTVATQALFMMNSAWVVQQSTIAAERVLAAPGIADDGGRVDLLYKRTLGRPATTLERQRALTFIKDYPATSEKNAGWVALTQTLIACAEFRYVN